MTSVEIPLQGSDTEVIEIAFEELPDDVEEVMHILKAENAQMHLWVTIAIEYYRRDKKENFTRVLPLFISKTFIICIESANLLTILTLNDYPSNNACCINLIVVIGNCSNRSKHKLRKGR